MEESSKTLDKYRVFSKMLLIDKIYFYDGQEFSDEKRKNA